MKCDVPCHAPRMATQFHSIQPVDSSAVAPHHIAPHHIAPHRIASHRITSHHTATQRIASPVHSQDFNFAHEANGPPAQNPHQRQQHPPEQVCGDGALVVRISYSTLRALALAPDAPFFDKPADALNATKRAWNYNVCGCSDGSRGKSLGAGS